MPGLKSKNQCHCIRLGEGFLGARSYKLVGAGCFRLARPADYSSLQCHPYRVGGVHSSLKTDRRDARPHRLGIGANQ